MHGEQHTHYCATSAYNQKVLFELPLSIEDIKEGRELLLDFSKIASVAISNSNIIPVAVQNSETQEVILIACTNLEALEKSVQTRIATFWSTSRNELWIKGKTSGHYFEITDILVNCEQNSSVYKVRPKGQGICHTYNSDGVPRNCFYRKFDFTAKKLVPIDK